jgi:hypothetical protein
MSNETEWEDEPPDWSDMNKRAEVRRKNGTVIVGELWATDYWIADDTEIPLWSIKLDDGTLVAWEAEMEWRLA